MIDAFTARFPKVALNLTNDVSKYLDGRIDRAFYANDEYVDVAMLETLQDYTRWKAENRLLYYKPANWNDIVNGEKDLDGAYVPFELGKAPVGVLETITRPLTLLNLTQPPLSAPSTTIARGWTPPISPALTVTSSPPAGKASSC